jgi:hypothetical protein
MFDVEVDIENLNLSHLTNNQASDLRNLLRKYKVVFNDKPGTCDVGFHEINLIEGFEPKAQRPYRIPEKLKAEVDRQINQLLEDGKIRPSKSPFAHPVVCVTKPSGEIRLCTDLRYVNSGTVGDSYPMPVGEDLLLKICPAKYISTLDCSSGFWQIPIRECDRYKTAFVTHSNAYEWNVTPFGAKTASNTYQRVMDTILRPHSEYACAYIDDTAVHSDTWKNHMRHLESVLNAFAEVGMSLKFSKCKFGLAKVKFIGHMVGSGVRRPLLDKVEAIKAIPEPSSKKMLRSFLGMMSFYRVYIPRFSEIAHSLTEMTKNTQPNKISFNEEQRNAFNKLKESLCLCTDLYAINFDKPFVLFTDAFDTAVAVAVT